MCGIAGFWASSGAMNAHAAGQAMADTLTHRGPDAWGLWHDDAVGVALAHRRLSIVDLSPAGAQPMTSACGRWVIAYNGEVYNAGDLRRRVEEAHGLPDGGWRGHSDTEAIVEHIARFGLDATLAQLIGMFAFALWDRKEHRLQLVRDRLGIKPLYWSWLNNRVIFGSELTALEACPGWTPGIDRNALAAYLRHNYIPAPRTIYTDVFKLAPGTLLELQQGGEPEVRPWWSLDDAVTQGRTAPLTDLDDTTAITTLEELLSDAIGRRMVADVPLGAFLSGGIDSSIVVALMQAQSDQAVRTFSIGFNTPGFNEAEHAKAVATHLGTKHTELYVSEQDLLDVVPRLGRMMDEPFADSSLIPTFLVSRMARDHVTVSLSGDGGDELFAGYGRYHETQRLWDSLSRFPRPLMRQGGRLLGCLPPQLTHLLPGRLGRQAERVIRNADILAAADFDALYRRLISHWPQPDRVVPGAQEPPGLHTDPAVRNLVPDRLSRMQYLDMRCYLPDDILTKVDRASMAVSLEARVPLLDHRIVEWSWRLPNRFKVRDGQSKWLLRQVLYRHVPASLIDRPKMGFGVPLGAWLRGPLRDWADSLLAPQALRECGLFDTALVRRYWDEHQKGQREWHYLLWDVLMVMTWLQARAPAPTQTTREMD